MHNNVKCVVWLCKASAEKFQTHFQLFQKKKKDFHTSSIKFKKYGLGKYIIYFYDLIEMKIVAFRYDCWLKGFACPTILIEF